MRIEPNIKWLYTPKARGFTVIEFVIVIVLTGILALAVSVPIGNSLLGYSKTVNRATLVDAAELSLQRMGRDLRAAIPNSVRVTTSGTIRALEMLNIVEGIRYRTLPPGTPLTFNTTTSAFDVIGGFQIAQLGSQGYRLVIYNVGAYDTYPNSPTAGSNVYSLVAATGTPTPPPAGTRVISPAGTTVTLSASSPNVSLSAPMQFAFPSPENRMYVVDTPISYICDTSTGQITRYSNYTITAAQPTSISVGSSALLTNNVTGCNFTYQPGTTTRTGIITMTLTLTKSGETITLIHQVAVSNVP